LLDSNVPTSEEQNVDDLSVKKAETQEKKERGEDDLKEEDAALKKENKKKSFKTIMAYAKRESCTFWAAMVCLVLGMGSSLAMPLFIGKSIDAMNRNDLQAVGNLTLILMAVIIGSGFCSAIKTYLFQKISARIARNLRYDFFESMLNKDVSFYDERKCGDLCSRLSSDV
jgi:ATP-binding cassette subfamily B protein